MIHKYTNKTKNEWFVIDFWRRPEQVTSEVYAWCDQHESQGGYFVAFQHRWYFENEEDATMFALKWA